VTKKTRIISIVREPISRNISHYFERHRLDKRHLKKGVEYLIKHFLYSFNHTLTLRWFDKFFEPHIDVDVYDYEFKNGYSKMTNEKKEVLILRTEKSDRHKENIIKDFLGIEAFEINQTNRSKTKWFSNVYKKFKEEFNPPVWYLKMMYRSKYFMHFYGKEYETEWRKKMPDGKKEVWDEGLKRYYEMKRSEK